MINDKNSYQFELKDKKLIFRSFSFRPERKSILHSGIYNREMAALLIASLIGGGMYVLFSFLMKASLALLGASLFMFAVSFLFFRTVVLKEPRLEAFFDKNDGKVSVIVKGFFKSFKDTFPLTSISDVVMNHYAFEPVNPDGIKTVERIALQHGTVIPGLGERKEIYTVDLTMIDKGKNKITLLATDRKDVAQEVMTRIKEYMGE